MNGPVQPINPIAPIPEDVIRAAHTAEVKWRVPASVSIAQWALESAYGRHMPPGSNNPFGIKAVAGQPSVNAVTHEFYHGRYVTIHAPFAKFKTIDDAFDRHAQLLARSPFYHRAMEALNVQTDHLTKIKNFTAALTGVYATDPNYGAKLMHIIAVHSLQQYDATV